MPESKTYRTSEQRWAIRRVSIRIYGQISLSKNHHWTRLGRCARALERFDWDEDKAVEFLRGK